MNKNIIIGYKELGETPLNLINRIKNENPDYKEERMAYAGRLDPMAEGVVLIIKGEELKNFDNYLSLDKDYRAKILFGVSTDTYDILGLPKSREKVVNPEEAKKEIENMKGDFEFFLPPYSSYKIKKKPLFYWAKEGRLDEIEIPKKKVEVYNIAVEDTSYLNNKELEGEIIRKIGKVQGDFRQELIVKEWNKLLQEERSYLVLDVFVSCGSGCYVRSIAHEVGERLGSGGLLLSLVRERVGDYQIRRDS